MSFACGLSTVTNAGYGNFMLSLNLAFNLSIISGK